MRKKRKRVPFPCRLGVYYIFDKKELRKRFLCLTPYWKYATLPREGCTLLLYSMKKTLFLCMFMATMGDLSVAADVVWDNSSTSGWDDGVSVSGGQTYSDGDTMIFQNTQGSIAVGDVAPGGIQATGNTAVNLSGGTIANSNELTISGEAGTRISISSNWNGNGNLAISGSGSRVELTGTRNSDSGTITIGDGATLAVTGGGSLFNAWNSSPVVNVNGTLVVDSLAYDSGNLGQLRDNSNALIMFGGSRLLIQQSGAATRGITINGWGSVVTIAVADNVNFTWNKSPYGSTPEIAPIATQYGESGSRLVFEVGNNSTFTCNKVLPAGCGYSKTGAGALILNEVSSLGSSDYSRTFNLEGGTLRYGVDAALGAASYVGDIKVSDGATLDLDGHISYNDIRLLAAGATLINAQNNRSAVYFATNKDGYTELNSDQMSNIGGTLSTEGILRLTLDSDLTSAETAAEDLPDWYASSGRLSGTGGVEISGTGEEAVTFTGYTQSTGTVSSEGGSVIITDVGSVTFADNAATRENGEEFARAGAIAAGDSITIETTGDISFTRNSSSHNSTGAGALYASNDVSLSSSEGRIILTDNRAGTLDDDWISGGAINAEIGSITLEAQSIEISRNLATQEGGALYSGSAITLNAVEGLVATGNNAAASGGFAYATGSLLIQSEGDVSITGNSVGEYGGAICSAAFASVSDEMEDISVAIQSQGNVTISGNRAGYSGGAIQVDGGIALVDIKGQLLIQDNTAGYDGGAMDAYKVVLSGNGETIISDNRAGEAEEEGYGYGGAISIQDGGELVLEATQANITFRDNEAATGKNDLFFQGDATAALTATEGREIRVEGGMNSSEGWGTVEVSINANGETGTVTVGGTSDIVATTTVSGGSFVLMNEAVYGRADDTGNGSSFTVTDEAYAGAKDGEHATINADTAEISNATVGNATLSIAEQVAISNSILKDVNITGSRQETSTITMEAATFTFGSGTDLTSLSVNPVIEGFSLVSGSMEVNATAEFLQAVAANGGSLAIKFFDGATEVGEGGFAISLSSELKDLLTNVYKATSYGFIDEGGNLVESLTLPVGTSFADWEQSAHAVVFTMEKLLPEPSTATLSLLALTALCLRRRRRTAC